MTRIAILQGHPTSGERQFCHRLADSYAQGASMNGHDVRYITVATIDFPLLRSKKEWEYAPPLPALIEAQQTLAWAEHIVIIFPLWLGGMPALLKAFLEQVLRPNFMTGGLENASWKTALKGKSARIVVTMGMPALLYRWYFGAHGLRSLKRSILTLVGIGPSRQTLIGNIEGMTIAKRKGWLETMRDLGRNAR